MIADVDVVVLSDSDDADMKTSSPHIQHNKQTTSSRETEIDCVEKVVESAFLGGQGQQIGKWRLKQNTDDRSDSVHFFETSHTLRKKMEQGILLFNQTAQKGIDFLIAQNLIDADADGVAEFFLSAPGLNKVQIGTYLGEHHTFNIQVMVAYLNRLQFRKQHFEEALRAFLAGFRLPGEAQKIDRIMQKFADRFCRDNPDVFTKSEHAYILAYGLIILNTDAHSPRVKTKMTQSQFMLNMRDLLKEGMPRSFLLDCFRRITEKEITISYGYLEQLYARISSLHVSKIKYTAKRRVSLGQIPSSFIAAVNNDKDADSDDCDTSDKENKTKTKKVYDFRDFAGLRVLQDGAVFTKHVRRGKPHLKRVWVDRSVQEIRWEKFVNQAGVMDANKTDDETDSSDDEDENDGGGDDSHEPPAIYATADETEEESKERRKKQKKKKKKAQKRGRKYKSLWLEDVVSMAIGKDSSPVFLRTDIDDVKDTMCFSLRTNKRTLDLEGSDPSAVKVWVDFFTQVVEDNAERRRARQLHTARLQREETIIENTEVWHNEMLPRWNECFPLATASNSKMKKHVKQFRQIWLQGVPPSLRKSVWSRAIGNALKITPRLFDAFYARRLMPTNGDSKEEQQKQRDLQVTFPELSFFHASDTGPGLMGVQLRELLATYQSYRPDVGYVKGMTHIGALMLLYCESLYDAFVCFANVLHSPFFFPLLQEGALSRKERFRGFEERLKTQLPGVWNHFQHLNISYDAYFMDWCMTMFTKCLPLEVASRIFDWYLLDGQSVFVHCGIAFLRHYRDDILRSSYDDCMFLLLSGISSWTFDAFQSDQVFFSPHQ